MYPLKNIHKKTEIYVLQFQWIENLDFDILITFVALNLILWAKKSSTFLQDSADTFINI